MRSLAPWLKNDADQLYLKYRLLEKASTVGPAVSSIVESIWARRLLDAFADVERLLRLSRLHSKERLESAARRALFYRQTDYFTISRILVKHLEGLPLSSTIDIYGQRSLWDQITDKSR
jgi:hypothetical protein